MAEASTLKRTDAMAGRTMGRPGVKLTPARHASRLSLRAPSASTEALSEALGLTLPTRPKTSARNGARLALWLGPDEWLVIDEGGADLVAVARSCHTLHSAVDVSHRNTAILVDGPLAAATVNAGCPQDLSLEAFPVGGCSRTLLGKIEIVLYRPSDESFRVECWRSFSDYAFTYLEAGARAAV